MFNEMIVGTITPFSGTTTPDKNGSMPVMIQCVAGKMPNRQVMSGTVAERQGLEVGKTYLIQVRERGFDKVFGEDFTWTKLMEIVDPLRIIELKKKEYLGEPQIITIDRPDGFEDAYERKSDAVESLQTKRIKEGQYIPVNVRTSVEHETAREIKEGSTVKDATEGQKLTDHDLNEHKRSA